MLTENDLREQIANTGDIDKLLYGYVDLSEDFIREFQNNIDWGRLSEHHPLSENFIREFKDKVYWPNIFGYQKLSDPFRKEFEYKLDLL